MDTLTKQQRSYNMSRIRSKNTGPERQLKPLMKALGFSYQPKLYGHPDFASRKLKIVVFIDGCFWHGCPKHYKAPKQNAAYWKKKVGRNQERDKLVNSKLRGEGWKVVRVWEHNLKHL